MPIDLSIHFRPALKMLIVLICGAGLLFSIQAQEETTISITGTISNGTVGAIVPDNLPVSLQIIKADTLEEVTRFSTSSLPDSTYAFNNIPAMPEAIYVVSTTHLGRDFSVPFQVEDNQTVHNTPLKIYELTTDPSALSIDSIVAEITGVTGLLEVRYEMLISNHSDRMFASGESLSDGRPIALEIPLPPASVLASDNFGRFVFDEPSFTVYDTQALLPGSEQSIRFVFLVPYSQTAIIEYPLPYQLSGQVIVLLKSDTLALISQEIPQIDRDAVEIDAKAYGSNLNRAAGELISYEIRGVIPQNDTTTEEAGREKSSGLIPILAGGIILVVLLLGGSFWLMRRSNNPEVNTDALINGLVRQINVLDADHKAGRINHDVYRNKRAELEARIQAISEGKTRP